MDWQVNHQSALLEDITYGFSKSWSRLKFFCLPLCTGTPAYAFIPSRYPLCSNKDMIPHQLPTCKQALELGCWWAGVKCCSNKTVRSCLWTSYPVFVCSSAATPAVILYYLLPAHGHRGGLSSLSSVHAACPFSTKTLNCSPTISTLPHLTSPLVPCKLKWVSMSPRWSGSADEV